MEGLAVPPAKRIKFRVASFHLFSATTLTLALVFELQWKKKENSLKNLNEVMMLTGLSQQLQIVHEAKTLDSLKSLHKLPYLPIIANYLPVQNFVAFRVLYNLYCEDEIGFNIVNTLEAKDQLSRAMFHTIFIFYRINFSDYTLTEHIHLGDVYLKCMFISRRGTF